MTCFQPQADGNFKAVSSALSPAKPKAAAQFLPRFSQKPEGTGMASPIIDFLLSRNSAPIQELRDPGPTDAEIKTMLTVAVRVPDHGRLAPWRFILYRGGARQEVGAKLADLAEQREGPLSEGRRNQELARFSRAPLVIGVVSNPKDHPKIPQWEMFLSGGMAALNLMIAANALGYGTNMISNWYSDVEEGRALLGLAPHERAVGFVHIGSYEGPAQERPRPDVTALYTDYSGPSEG
jgi:nitroreductase